jgi:predicted phage gp36 major capsid-like protein
MSPIGYKFWRIDMAAKKTAKELRDEARARYRQALEAARKVEAHEKMALGEKLQRTANELGAEPEELLNKIKTVAVGLPMPPEGAAGETELEEPERYSD